MSSFLISQLENLSKENLNFVLDITNEKILDNITKFILSKKDKDDVLFFIGNNKISKSLSFDLFKFIVDNKYWDMFLNLDCTKFDIHAEDDYVLRSSSYHGNIEVVKFLLNYDLEYFFKNKIAIDIVKKHKLIEFYKKFGIIEEEPSQKIPQSKNDIMKYIDTNDIESLKNCNEF
jgi:hypothetical protein